MKKQSFLGSFKGHKKFTLDDNPMYVRKMVKTLDTPILLYYMKEYVPDKTE